MLSCHQRCCISPHRKHGTLCRFQMLVALPSLLPRWVGVPTGADVPTCRGIRALVRCFTSRVIPHGRSQLSSALRPTCKGGSGADADRSAGGFQNSGGGSLQATWSHTCRVPQPPAQCWWVPGQQIEDGSLQTPECRTVAHGHKVKQEASTKYFEVCGAPLTVSSTGVLSSGEAVTFLGRPAHQEIKCSAQAKHSIS